MKLIVEEVIDNVALLSCQTNGVTTEGSIARKYCRLILDITAFNQWKAADPAARAKGRGVKLGKWGRFLRRSTAISCNVLRFSHLSRTVEAAGRSRCRRVVEEWRLDRQVAEDGLDC